MTRPTDLDAAGAAPAVDTTPLCDGRFVPFRRLGAGSQAETLEAVDRANGSVVALKRFNVHGAQSWKDVELAEREARVLSSLSHPMIAKYVHHFEQDGALYLAMERVDGRDLASCLAQGQRFSLEDLHELLLALADVFDYLHRHSPPIVHRDIKPSNIVKRSDGGYALVDFGSVRDGLRPEGGSTVVGTFGYMAPEQFQGRALPASDLYGTGATLITLMTGCSPDKLPHRGLQIDVRASLPASTPPAWIEVLERLLAADPDQRAVDLRDLLRALPKTAAPSQTKAADGFANFANRSRPPPPHGEASPASPPERIQSEWVIGAGTSIPFFLLVLLHVARLLAYVALQIVLPVLLTVLSAFFGRSLRRSASDVTRAGQTIDRQIKRTLEQLERAGPMTMARRRSDWHRTARNNHWYSKQDGTESENGPRRRRMRVGNFDVELPQEESENDPQQTRRRK